MLGAGTLYKNFEYSTESRKWTGTILGATSGGNKLTITPTITDIEVDGVLVKAKGLRQKTGETAQIETNMVEITKEYLQSTVIGQTGTSVDSRFDVIESKELIEDSDYIENFAFVGFKTDGSPIIVILILQFAHQVFPLKERTMKLRLFRQHLNVLQNLKQAVTQINYLITFMCRRHQQHRQHRNPKKWFLNKTKQKEIEQ